MKWIGQNIYDQVSKFRNDVHLESISSGTIASGAHLGLDSNNKIVKAVDGGGDITSVVAGTNLSGGATSGAATINLADASTSAKGAASFSSANFAASSGAITIKDGGVDLAAEVTGVLPSANMDADTAHLSTIQTFTGAKTFGNGIIIDGDYEAANVIDGAAIHVDAMDITDGNTSASGTTSNFKHISIETPRLLATNSSVTTTSAVTLYIKGAPIAHTNQTITNAYSLLVDSGDVRVDEDLIVGGDIDLQGDIDVNGTLETDALTVGGTNVLTGSLITTLGTISAGVWNGTDIGVEHGGTGASNLDAFCLLAGSQTLTGTKTLNSFKGTGAVTVTNILDSDTMSGASATTLATSESIKAYADTKVDKETTKLLTYHGFSDDIDTTKHYIGLLDADSENPTASHQDMPFVFPTAGKLLKVFLRSNQNLSGKTLTWRLETQALTVNSGTGPSVIGTQSGVGCTNSNMTTYDFTSSLDSGTNVIAAGDTVFLSVQSSATTSNTKYFITCLWENDLS